jgi:hypothetical protein
VERKRINVSKHYLCGIDYQQELEEGCADLYDSIEALKKQKPRCWDQCGIVELELDETGNEVGHKWIVDQDFSRNY